jgi:metallo-beta-lactamase class B
VKQKIFSLLIRVLCFLAICFLLNPQFLPAQKIHAPINDSNWVRDQEPFRIAGNLYYVGSYDLASYLISTPKGLILINTGVDGSDSMIRRHMEMLGFHFSDIKILLATHAHYDHVGGMAAIKSATAAKLMTERGDVSLMEDGGSSDVNLGGHGPLFYPVKPDRILKDHDTVTLGGQKIIVLHHPGHTPGASSYLFNVKDDHRSYVVLIANMPSILSHTTFPHTKGYPDAGKDYAYTFSVMPKLKFDIWLASHANQFDLQKKHPDGTGYTPEAFIDPAGYAAAMEDLTKAYQERLKGTAN